MGRREAAVVARRARLDPLWINGERLSHAQAGQPAAHRLGRIAQLAPGRSAKAGTGRFSVATEGAESLRAQLDVYRPGRDVNAAGCPAAPQALLAFARARAA